MIEKLLWEKFRFKPRDTMPYYGYNQEATREVLAEAMGEAGFKTGAEVGVYYGQFSEVLCKKIPGLNLVCVDPWKPFPRRAFDEAGWDRVYDAAKFRLSLYPDVTLMRMESAEAAKSIPNASLDFVYIDAQHDFDHVMTDIILWTPKVRPRGIVAGHDFLNFYLGGVMDAVYAYTRAHNILSWYLTSGEAKPSWFWIK